MRISHFYEHQGLTWSWFIISHWVFLIISTRVSIKGFLIIISTQGWGSHDFYLVLCVRRYVQRWWGWGWHRPTTVKWNLLPAGRQRRHWTLQPADGRQIFVRVPLDTWPGRRPAQATPPPIQPPTHPPPPGPTPHTHKKKGTPFEFIRTEISDDKTWKFQGNFSPRCRFGFELDPDFNPK